MKVFKRIISAVIVSMFAVMCTLNEVSFADEYYDMKYFRFTASCVSGDNLPSNVKTAEKQWSTEDTQKPGDYFLIDMYQDNDIGKIVLKQKENEYPGKYSVYISNKMEDFGNPIVADVSGRAGSETVINLPYIITGRFIKIVLQKGTEQNNNPWSIQSLKVYHANDESAQIKYPDVKVISGNSKQIIHRDLLETLGINLTEFDGTRASFADIFVKYINRTPMQNADGNIYTDVNALTRNAQQIELLSTSIEKNTTFYPDKDIILDDALKWILNALGYEKRTELYGGYPYGYRLWASHLKLLDGVSAGYTDVLSIEDAVELLYNGLMTPIVNSADIEDNTAYYNAAYEWHGIKEIQGNLISNGYTSRSGEPLVTGTCVMIENDIYYDPDGIADDYIGMQVTAYVRSEDSSIVYIAPSPNKNNVIVIPAENIDSADVYEIRYCNNIETDSKIRTAKFDNHPDMIYNGKGCTPFEPDKMNVSNGTVKLIDSDNNGKYDLVLIEEYVDYYLGYIDVNNLLFSDIYSNPNISLKADSVINYKIYYQGKEISFEEIPNDCILSVAADVTKKTDGVLTIDTDKSSIYRIYVSDEAVSGRCDSKTDNDIVVIDGIEFEIGEQYKQARKKGYAIDMILSKKYKFYLDHNNRIAAVEEISDSGQGYGLLVKTVFEGVEADDFKLSLQMLTTAGKFMTYPVKEKVQIDGENKRLNMTSTKEIFYGDVTSQKVDPLTGEHITITNNQLIPQVIGYTINDSGEISKIDTKAYNKDKESRYNNIYHIPVERYTCNVYRGMIYPTENKSTAPNMSTVGAKVFVGPANINEADILNDYKVHNSNYFVQDGKYDMEVFKKSEYNALEIAFVQPGASSMSMDSTNYIIVDKVGVGLTNDDEIKTYIKGVQAGGEFNAYVYNEAVLSKSGLYENGKCTLKHGDLIVIEANARGEIVTISRVFDVDDKDIALSNNGKYYNEQRKTVGQVYKNKGASVMVTSTKRVTEEDAEDSLELFEMPSGAIVYDEESDEIRAATINDIKAYSKIHDENKTSLVFICTTWGQNVSFVIYNFE